MRITSRGFTAVTVGLVSAVLLVGCSSNSTKPTVLPTLTTSSAAPTTTPRAAPHLRPPTSATATTARQASADEETPTQGTPPSPPSATKFVRSYYSTAAAALHNPSLLAQDGDSLFIDTCARLLRRLRRHRKSSLSHGTGTTAADTY